MDRFKDYIGKKISVKEDEWCILEEENEPTIAEIRLEWSGAFRVIFPSTVFITNYSSGRLNVFVEKNDNGDYVIKRFTIG